MSTTCTSDAWAWNLMDTFLACCCSCSRSTSGSTTLSRGRAPEDRRPDPGGGPPHGGRRRAPGHVRPFLRLRLTDRGGSGHPHPHVALLSSAATLMHSCRLPCVHMMPGGGYAKSAKQRQLLHGLHLVGRHKGRHCCPLTMPLVMCHAHASHRGTACGE